MKNICFVSNFEKTKFFLEISKKLDKNKIFWICVNLKEFKTIKKHYKESQILYLKKNDLISDNSNSSFKINELIFSDRSMNVKRKSDKNYLINAELHISNFIKLNNIEYIFQ